MHNYNIKLNGSIMPCAVCAKIGQHVQHHVYARRYSDKSIWVCNSCHKRIHSNPKWAYENGYMRTHNNLEVDKAKKKNSCA